MGGFGRGSFNKFKKGGNLSKSNSIIAKCYQCNGEGESSCDCQVPDCPLYPYSPYKGIKDKENIESDTSTS